jgi:hypothetical protein
MIDAYPIYCVSSQSKDFHWINYAGSHKGFCIEFNFEEGEHPEAVTYQAEIPSMKILDFLSHDLGIDTSNSLGIKIKNALLVKREELRPESEYRWIASNAMGRVVGGNKFVKIQYDPRKVKSIIFGARMERGVKEYIIKNLSLTVPFKQAIEIENSLVISDYDGEKH